MMKDRTVTTVIDAELCIGCGSCVDVCPSETIELQGERAVVVGDESLNCGHCEAVCPANAIHVKALDPEMTRFSTFRADSAWLPFGEPDTAQLVRLMASRRSCRNFREAPVEVAQLEDLAKIGATAPSGTNSQRWRFTILPDRAAVLQLGKGVARFFRALNWIADRSVLRRLERIIGRGELQSYHEEYQERIEEALEEWHLGERERLFHGAVAAILVSSLPNASCPAEDALLATQNILLAAHSMGLGTCLIGFAVQAIRLDPRLWRQLELGGGEKVHSVIAIGHPNEVYEKTAGRLPASIRFIQASKGPG